MVKVRGSTIIVAALHGGIPPKPAAKLGLDAMQIVKKGRVEWAKKDMWLRNMPITVVPEYASDGQVDVRLKFSSLAHEAKSLGPSGVASAIGGRVVDERRKLVEVDGEILPYVAAYIKKKMEGYKSPFPSRRLPRSLYGEGAYAKEARRRGILERVARPGLAWPPPPE